MLVAMTGRKRHGKDSVAEVFQEWGFERISFAGPLKGMIAFLLESAGLTEDEIEYYMNGDGKETELACLQGKSARYAMQTLGTEWRDLLGKDLWTDIVRSKVGLTQNAVITDMRFLHEERFVDEHAGVKIRVIRSGMPVNSDPHPSEVEQDSIEPHFTIFNYGNYLDLMIAAEIALWAASSHDLMQGLETTKFKGNVR